MKIRKIICKSAISKCGFPGGGWAINPYVGCEHGCVYCYARFMRRFTGHEREEWGNFVDVRTNIAEVLQKQMELDKYKMGRVFISTVTDPYQPLEKKYQLTRKVLKVLLSYQPSVSILTKSDLILRDLKLLKQFKDLDISFTINTLDEKWREIAEPNSSAIAKRLLAIKRLVGQGINCKVMMGPYWPVFTDPQSLFKKFKQIGISHVFTESLNTIGGNWVGVEKVLKKYYPNLLPAIKEIMFNRKKFTDFYKASERKLKTLSKQYSIPITIYFSRGHTATNQTSGVC